jgi:hypothetical protein
MACSMGSAVKRQVTVRPFLVRVMRPAPDSTSMCFMIAGSDMGNGSASSLTERACASSSRASSARLVGSARAAKVRSRTASLYLTIKLSVSQSLGLSMGLSVPKT